MFRLEKEITGAGNSMGQSRGMKAEVCAWDMSKPARLRMGDSGLSHCRHAGHLSTHIPQFHFKSQKTSQRKRNII